MDSLISAAARALGTGDAIGALKRVSLRDDPPALALRAMVSAMQCSHQVHSSVPSTARARISAHAVATKPCTPSR
jgi:hypothetical protein